MSFQAAHITRSAQIRLAAAPNVTFPLFEPLGERAWVEGWDPQPLFPASGEAMEGAVFLTQHPGEPATIWSIVVYDPEQHCVAYLRVTPNNRIGRVEVSCTPEGDAATLATVTYTFTALTEAGNVYLAHFTAEHYADYIASWETDINAYLGRASA
jgi:hypothetical protein